ncbi:hypothetical protein BHM03_00008487 [Ensete ventricosum]|nr:hypothetical protein BHM03_00008487 [Ensete ventricosum]
MQCHLCLKGDDVLCQVCAPVVGFQRGKPEGCGDWLNLYFLSERGPREWDHPMFLFRHMDLIQSLGDMA